MIKSFANFTILFILSFFLSAPVHSYSDKNSLGNMSAEILFNNHNEFESNFNDYVVNNSIDLQALLGMDVFILFGAWCHDSQREVPRLLKILKELGMEDKKIHLIGLDYQKNEPGNRGFDFKVTRTPTFVFQREGIEIGRIEERPTISLENHLFEILAAEIN